MFDAVLNLRNPLPQLCCGGSSVKLNTMEDQTLYTGVWVTKDGSIRQELWPGGRYGEARGCREYNLQGDYIITGNHIDYRDDTGRLAYGYFKNDTLYHVGMILYREQ